jgi:hypothetical protein
MRWRPVLARPIPPARRGRGRLRGGASVTPRSNAWCKAPSPWQRHWGCASRKRTPWWASDTSPGIGMWAHADQPDIGDGVMGGAKGPGRDQGRPVAREAGDAVDARRLNGLGKGHRR